jgi:hypothetical protein
MPLVTSKPESHPRDDAHEEKLTGRVTKNITPPENKPAK